MSGRPSSILNGWKSAILLLSFIVPLLHGTARATTAPPGLLPGDTYQFVFVTQAVINATSPDLSIYDAFAQNEALLNPALTGASTTFVYHAIVATKNQPDMQFNSDVGPTAKIFLVNGTSLVASGAADFWDGNQAIAMSYNQGGHGKSVVTPAAQRGSRQTGAVTRYRTHRRNEKGGWRMKGQRSGSGGGAGK